MVAEFLVLGSQPGDLVAVGPQLLAERVGGGPLGGGQRSRSSDGGVAEPGDLVAELGLAVQPGPGHSGGLGEPAEGDRFTAPRQAL